MNEHYSFCSLGCLVCHNALELVLVLVLVLSPQKLSMKAWRLSPPSFVAFARVAPCLATHLRQVLSLPVCA